MFLSPGTISKVIQLCLDASSSCSRHFGFVNLLERRLAILVGDEGRRIKWTTGSLKNDCWRKGMREGRFVPAGMSVWGVSGGTWSLDSPITTMIGD
jgi:hypothetical protein